MRSSYTILYVDDDKDDLYLISNAFEQYTEHLKVVHAHNGFEALQMLKYLDQKSMLPCLIILDINMPVMDGKQTLAEIRKVEKFNNIPVVMFSTSSNSADRKFAQSLGADFITKPDHYNDLEKLVKEFVQRCLVDERA